MRLLYFLPIIGAVVGALEFLSTLTRAQSAPQQAAGAAMAVAYALLPYIFARGMVELVERPAQQPGAMFVSPGIQPQPAPADPLTAEESDALKAKRTRRFLIGAMLVLAFFVFAAVSIYNEQSGQLQFSEPFPDAR